MNKRALMTAIVSSCMLFAAVPGAARAGDDGAAQKALAQRVQLLEDRAAIHDLLITYGRLLDQKDLVGYSKLFARDGVWEGGIGSATGPAGVQAMLEKVYSRVAPDAYGSDYHIMSDILITVNGDTASSRSNWTWIVEGADGKPQPQRSGHYEDKLVREDGQWRFKHRLTVTELPTPEKDGEAQVFRKDHRAED